MSKKILFVTYDFPWPTNSGGKSRIYNLIKFSKNKNLEFYLYSFIRKSFKKNYEEQLSVIGVKKTYTHLRKSIRDPLVWGRAVIEGSSMFKLLYFDQVVEAELIDIIRKEDIQTVVFESFYTSFYISDKIREMGVKQIFGTENIEHALYFDYAKEKGLLKNLYMSQVAKVRQEEESAYSKSDLVFAVTQNEKDFIRSHIYPESSEQERMEIIPNGVDTKKFAYSFRKEIGKNLLFVGNFSYFPNVDALKFFYYEIFNKLPNMTLTLIGKHQDKLTFLKNDKRVIKEEYIEDIKSMYYRADIFVFPVRFGGGTNFKVLEAASCGTPIIAIPDRVRELGFTPDQHYISAVNGKEFIQGINRLIVDTGLRKKISENARTLVEKKYDWHEIGSKLGSILESI